MQTKRIAVKDYSRLEEPKTKDLKSVPLYDDPVEPTKKENKQKRLKR